MRAVTGMEEMRSLCKILIRKPNGKTTCGDIVIDRRISKCASGNGM